ncbi:MAG: glycosyltransferase family 4 protein [Gammaproteobacteria bacterium]
MRVLVLAPHPFYQERGTPIAVDLLVRALCERGDEVDLLTFHEGSDRRYEGLQIRRIKPFFRITDVPPGFSWKKIVCDVHLFGKFISLMFRNRYHVVHAIEEAGLMALVVCPLRRTPYVYDMDSSMTTQIVDKFTLMRPLERVLRFMESLPMRYADAVVPVCDALAQEVHLYRTQNVVVLKDVSLLNGSGNGGNEKQLRDELALRGKIAMYIGNLEAYQGIDLMLESFAAVREVNQDVELIVVGGADADIEKYKELAVNLRIGNYVHFLGRRPVSELGSLTAQADVLLSPRVQGVNTPMKIYSYLHSGTAVLATDSPTHTQVMDDQIAMLARPDRLAFADAMVHLLDDDAKRTRLGVRARAYIEREHSYDTFRHKLHGLYSQLETSSV